MLFPDFETMAAAYYEPLYRFAISLTRSEADACDLAQQFDQSGSTERIHQFVRNVRNGLPDRLGSNVMTVPLAALVMADRSVPGPLSAVLLTTCAEAVAPPAKTSMCSAGIKADGSNKGQQITGPRTRRKVLGWVLFIHKCVFSAKVHFHFMSRKNIGL